MLTKSYVCVCAVQSVYISNLAQNEPKSIVCYVFSDKFELWKYTQQIVEIHDKIKVIDVFYQKKHSNFLLR